MKEKTSIPPLGMRTPSGILRKAGSYLAASCAAMPLYACCAQLTGVRAPQEWCLLALIPLVFSLAALLMPAGRARLTVPAACVLSCAVSFLAIGGGAHGAAAGLAGAVICFVYLSKRSQRPGFEWSSVFWTSGLVWQLILWSMFRSGFFFDISGYRRAVRLCAAAGAVYLLLFILYLNRLSLISGSHSDITGKQVAPRIRFRNQTAVVFVSVIAAAAGFSREIAGAASAAWDGFLKLLSAVIGMLMSLFSYNAPAGISDSGGGGGSFPIGEVTERSLLSRILEGIMYAAAAVILVILLYHAFKGALKALKRLAVYIRERLSRMMDTASEDYTETVSDTREDRDEGRAEHVRRAREREGRISCGRDLVRRLYRTYLKKHPDRRGMTCREALGEEGEKALFSEMYERARYSGHEVTMAESEELREKLRKSRIL